MQEVIDRFSKAFGSSPTQVTRAPGRLELLGNHTDYNDGLVMALAVDKYVYIAAAPRPDEQIELVSSAFPGREGFSCDRIEKNPAASWANYVKGVLVQLRKRAVPFLGFNALIHGTIPFGAGMSSSAALEVATALIVRRLFPFTLTANDSFGSDAVQKMVPLSNEERLALAKLCQSAESEFVGVNCGLLDQISSLFGKASHVIEIDCRDLTVQHSPMPEGIAVIVCDSGVKHDLSAGDYNQLRRCCEAAARALGVPALRAVGLEMLENNRGKLAPREYECAFHIVGENQRVLQGRAALRKGAIELFGQLLFQSHESSRDYFKNSCPELDILVQLARAQPGCLGARLTGGGFGGATINLVKQPDVNRFVESMARDYQARTGRQLEPLICKIVDGAE